MGPVDGNKREATRTHGGAVGCAFGAVDDDRDANSGYAVRQRDEQVQQPAEYEHAGGLDVTSHGHPEHAEALDEAVYGEEPHPETHVVACAEVGSTRHARI